MGEKSKKLSENLEDYLEVIASLSADNGSARLTDIAKAMSVKKPSATAALITLSERGLVEYEKYKPVVLTSAGESVARNVRSKHELLSGFFTGVLGVDSAAADVAACRMEHALEDSIMRKLVEFLQSAGTGSCSDCSKNPEDCAGDCPHSMTLDKLGVGERALILDIDTSDESAPEKAGHTSKKSAKKTPAKTTRKKSLNPDASTAPTTPPHAPDFAAECAKIGLVAGATVEILRESNPQTPALLRICGTEFPFEKRLLCKIKVKRI